jgi:hypothetical protein
VIGMNSLAATEGQQICPSTTFPFVSAAQLPANSSPPLKQHTDDSLQDAERIHLAGRPPHFERIHYRRLIQSPAKGLDERDPPRHHNAISA